jgi:NarL family two-component system response regulator LiaR
MGAVRTMIRIVIADDHFVVREGLRTLLELDPELEVVGEAANGAEAVQAARDIQPDIVVMDLVMPEMDGVTATRMIRQDLPRTEVVAVTSVLEGSSLVSAIQAGAAAYILKDTRAEELRRAIKAAAAGQVQVPPRIAARLYRELQPPTADEPLSNGEIDVLRLLAAGHNDTAIARLLDVSEDRIRSTVSGILDKLRLQSRTMAAIYATQIGLIPLDRLGDCAGA